jgi:hypothetical protein
MADVPYLRIRHYFLNYYSLFCAKGVDTKAKLSIMGIVAVIPQNTQNKTHKHTNKTPL